MMTKKQRKRITVKKLGAVLLGIILGASLVPAAALAVERTGSEYSAVEQTEAAAAEKETLNGRDSLEEAVASRETWAEEAADSFETGAEQSEEAPGDGTDAAADPFETGAEQTAETPGDGTDAAADSFETGAEQAAETPGDGTDAAADSSGDQEQAGKEAGENQETGNAGTEGTEAENGIPVRDDSLNGTGNPAQDTAIDGENSESVSTLPGYAGENDNQDGQANDTLAEAVDPSTLQAGDSIILVNSANARAVSIEQSGRRLASVPAASIELDEIKVLTEIPSGAAVFVIEEGGGGSILLKTDAGYLTSAATGNGLSYVSTANDYSQWEIRDGTFLYAKNVINNSYKNYYLEFYSNGFTTYGKTKNSDIGAFSFDFFRLKDDSGPPSTPAEKNNYHLPVFETSDVHGFLADTSTENYQYRLAYISDKVRDVRGWGDAYDKSLAVLLDGGDIYQGNIISNLVKGESLSAAYEAMDYDAVTIGNHDFDWYIESTVDPDATMTDYTLDGQTFVNDVPVVIANLRKNGENVGFADDYIILEKTATDKDGEQISVRIAVIGFAEDYAKSIMENKFSGEGFSIQEDYDLANQLAAELEESGKCDASILLCHLAADEAARRLGENTAVDLVLGGHTHLNKCGVNDWGLHYLQPANNSTAYAYAELVFETDEQGVPTLTAVKSTRTVDVLGDVEKLKKDPANEQELDEKIVELTDLFLEKIQGMLNEKIGYITTSATKTALPESGGRSSTMGNWMASMCTRALDADVCFMNGGAIRTAFVVDEETPERDIHLSDIYTIFPFENVLYEYEITYEELMELLDYAMTGNGSILLSRVVGIDCYFYDNTVNAVLKDGKLIYQAGEWMDGWKDKKLRVVVSEYIATTNRTDGDRSNPFCAWAETDRLLSKDHLDSDSAIEVLCMEAAENDGHLTIDPEPHFINKVYVEGDHQLEYTAAVPAACEEEGRREYWTCGVCGRLFADQDGTQQIEKEDLIVTATGHDWLPPTYEWNSENTEVTAMRVCKNDSSHCESETVKVTSEITIEPTSAEEGKRTYTSETFLNPAFAQQTKTERIPADDTDDPPEEDPSGEDDPAGEDEDPGKEEDPSGKEEDPAKEENPSGENDPSGKEEDSSGEQENPDKGTVTYRVADGDGSTWTKGGSRSAVFVFKRSRDDAETFSHFTGLLMDGKTVPESGFKAAAGSLIITLAPEYLETLSTGKHILTACFEDGNDPTAKFTILAAEKDEKEENSGDKNKIDSSEKTVSKKENRTVSNNERRSASNTSPKTGDENRTGLWLMIMMFSVLGAALVVALHKRQDNKRS